MSRLRRLSWAGVELIHDGIRVLIDPLNDVARLQGFLGSPHETIIDVGGFAGTTHALVTHRHPDHFDPVTLKRVVGAHGAIFCPLTIADEVGAGGLRARGMETWEKRNINGIVIAAVPAADWRGDDQVSWVIEHDGRRIIHCGDTIWHGQWWNIAREHGPFDWAFLPINGVIARYPGLEPSGLPATLTPKHACVAARILRAAKLCPIHYGVFNNPPVYAEHPNLLDALARSSDEEHVDVRLCAAGEILAD
jgi:L-ascorbate metabolism protein UlaG (beta-lactamase superfamily)